MKFNSKKRKEPRRPPGKRPGASGSSATTAADDDDPGDAVGSPAAPYCRFQKIAPRVRNSRKISKNLANFARRNCKF